MAGASDLHHDLLPSPSDFGEHGWFSHFDKGFLFT
jgi:hypothetical protein